MTMLSAHSFADEIQIGSGTQKDYNIPTQSNYNYSLTQQIYTAAEIENAGGGAGSILSIAFYNDGTTKTRTWDIYLINTSKDDFTSGSDWITATNADKVFSGSVTMSAGTWTVIPVSSFNYDGGNLAVVVDDNTNSCSYGMGCLIYTDPDSKTRCLYGRDDYTNYDPLNPITNGNAYVTFKNQIKLDIELASVTCAKPKNFTAISITAHEATLTWTAGAEGQSNWDVYMTTTANDVPDENTTPTYQVTECSKALTNLTTQTTYYAYVRANCGGGDKSKWANKTFTTTREALAVDANNPYSQDFETNNDWGFTNGTLTNNWCWGNTVNNGGQKSMYVSKDGGTTYEYAHGNTAIYASKLFNFGQGTYTFVFDWNAKGESTYDYLRVALAPGDVEFTAGTSLYSGVGTSSLPNGWIALDGGSKLNLKDNWQTQTAEANVSGTYTMVFIWRNDGSGGTQPPAAIDNISINFMTCPRPTNLTASNIAGRTATLTWTENGTATNWVLQYGTASDFTGATSVSVSGTPSIELSGLTPETKYYARVKSVLGSDESSWSDVKDFTTTATCIKPTSVTANNITAYTATIGWTNGEEGQDAWEISYSTSTQSNPENGTVIAVESNPYTLTELTPETSYYVYVRADCGSEDGKSAWSSSKYFTTLATCVKPSGLTASDVTATTATITWTAGEAGQDAWNLQYKKSSDSEWQTVAVATTSYNLTNLSPVTTYNVRVQADCGEGDLSQWTSNTSFTTECGALTLLYSCNFENVALETSPSSNYPYPKCWTRNHYRGGYEGSYTYYPSIRDASYSYPYAHAGNGANATSGKSMHFYKPYTSTDESVVLPEIDAQYNIKDLQISFWARLESYQTNKGLSIGVMTNPSDLNTFTEVATVTVKDDSFQEYIVYFSNYTGTGRNIAIRYNSNTTGYIFVDDINVDVVPTCVAPSDMEVIETGLTTASLKWTAGIDETEWNIQYKKAIASDWSESIHVTELPTDANPFVLTGLKRGTEYDVRIQAYCDADDQSQWISTPVSFTTECGTWPIDATNGLFENFNEETFPPACWNWIRVDNYYGWQHSTNVYNPIDPSGTAYSYWPTGDTYLILPQMHIDGNAKLDFDMAFSSSGSGEESSVVVSTTGYAAIDFSNTLWTATEFPTTKTNISLDLSAYNGQDVYIAFKFAGVGTEGRTWYIDNVQVYVGEIITKEISAYDGDGGYYLIASPIGTVNPQNVTNMLDNSYDLYYFDQEGDSEGKEWINYKGNDGNFNLVPGKGYLYANSQNVTLRFIGTPYNDDGVIDLTYASGTDLAGWNLIGNPFTTASILDKPYYRLNTNGSALNAETESTAVAAMEGVFVQATETGQNATFTAQTRGSEQAVIARTNIMVSSDNGNVLDNAIIRFDNGETLGKFQLKENSTKVYIPVNGKDYAIVNAKTQNELPVNFKAAKNGTYTLSVNTENVEMNYLHLIDNMTGADVNLLECPSYSFEAKTSDYVSRFKLVFDCKDGPSTSSGTFAFISNGKLVVMNEGQATLQVIDMMGRVLSSETFSGNAEISLGQTPGVYMLRLINGNDVKTQKIIIQ